MSAIPFFKDFKVVKLLTANFKLVLKVKKIQRNYFLALGLEIIYLDIGIPCCSRTQVGIASWFGSPWKAGLCWVTTTQTINRIARLTIMPVAINMEPGAAVNMGLGVSTLNSLFLCFPCFFFFVFFMSLLHRAVIFQSQESLFSTLTLYYNFKSICQANPIFNTQCFGALGRFYIIV